jgi:hypothetical protein
MRLGGVRRFRLASIIVGVALVVAVVVLASWWYSNRTDPESQVISYAQSDKSADPHGGESRECLDGTRVASGEECADLQSNDVLFGATGVTEDRCTADRGYPWNAPGQSFTCTIGSTELHVARYRSASLRADRVASYGKCSRLGGGWKICGKNPDNQRYVRTYVAKDLLFYVSSTNKRALLDLGAASEDVVRHGR